MVGRAVVLKSLKINNSCCELELCGASVRGTQRQFLENICSEDDLRPRIFGTFVVKFLACLSVLGFSNCLKSDIIAHFKRIFTLKKGGA